MTRFLIDVYKVEIPDNGQSRDDLAEATEDWLGKLGRDRCYSHQVQGNTLADIAKQIQRSHETSLRPSGNATIGGGPPLTNQKEKE